MNTEAETGRTELRSEPVDPIVVNPELGPDQLVTALLRQQKTLLTELSWAYEQLERFQESDIAEIRARLNQLEYQVSKSSRGRFLPSEQEGAASLGWLAGTRKRVEFTVRYPRRALRIAERRLRGEPSGPSLVSGQ